VQEKTKSIRNWIVVAHAAQLHYGVLSVAFLIWLISEKNCVRNCTHTLGPMREVLIGLDRRVAI
jgi:hypothetical protein